MDREEMIEILRGDHPRPGHEPDCPLHRDSHCARSKPRSRRTMGSPVSTNSDRAAAESRTEQRFVELTASQRDQLQAFIGEKDTSEERVNLRPAQTLPASYVEAVLLDADGEPTPKKRI